MRRDATPGRVVDPVVASVRSALHALGVLGEPAPRLIVALSGGLDSCVLLHALRFGLDADVPLGAAHFDHRMRAAGERDAAWVRGLCRAWDVDLWEDVAAEPPSSEEIAREARYAFLESVRRRHSPARVLTAHHADDQAETVLFRALRGTGIAGLAGIPAARPPGVVRPLLGLPREALEAYAERFGLAWREDATNEHLGFARNVLRHELLPLAEEKVAPGARAALVHLADIARSEELAWSDALEIVLATLDLRRGEAGSVSVDRDALVALGAELRARVVRHLVETTGVGREGRRLSAEATARAVDFAAAGRSGGRIQLGGGVELRRELDRIVVERSSADEAAPADREVTIERPDARTPADRAEALLGGRSVQVRWSVGEGHARPGAVEPEPPAVGAPEWAALPIDALRWPLRVRGRRPGDRIETTGGTRKVTKAMLEARIPSRARDTTPVLVDARGRVLWIPGVARAVTARPTAVPANSGEDRASDPERPGVGERVLWIGIGP